MGATPLMTGTKSRCTLFVANTKRVIVVESFNVKQDADVFSDGVCGEDRNRPGKEINLYNIGLKLFNESTDTLRDVMGYDEGLDSDDVQDVVFGLLMRDKRGRQDLFKADECVIDDWEWAQSGRTARAMLTVPIRARYFKRVAT